MVDTPPQISIYSMVSRKMDKRVKQFCPKGHDTFLTGRQKGNRGCNLCAVVYRNRPEVILRQLERDKKRRIAKPELYTRRSRESGWKTAGIKNADGSPFTLVDFDRAYQIQQGRCLGCGLHQSQLKRSLHADHDHKTGIFRCLLCVNCNKILGHARDNADTLDRLSVLLRNK